MCDRWPFPACQRWEGEKQREYLTHTPKHTSRASDAFPTALLSDLWLWLADCWVMVECEHTHTHTHTHIDAKSQIHSKVIISMTQIQDRILILFLYYGHCMQIFNMHRIYRWPQGWSFMSNMHMFIHPQKHTHIYIYKYAALRSVSATRRQRRERERERVGNEVMILKQQLFL